MLKVLAATSIATWASSCPTPNPCNNQGTCIDIGNSYKCRCKENDDGVPMFVGEICQTPNPCLDYPCNDHGTCSPTAIKRHGSDFRAQCHCDVGYEGNNCEVIVRCREGTCKNGGKCIALGNDAFRCLCPDQFAGARCEQVNFCSSNRCSGGSTCINEENAYRCECPSVNGIPVLHGKDCQIDVNECLNNPCKNGGICSNLYGDYECSCSAPWFGKNCEEKAPAKCNEQFCNHGQCKIDSNTGLSRCECEKGFGGARCDINIDDCPANECQNGAQCDDRINGYECLCQKGWTGRYCNIDVDECSSRVGSPCRNGGTCVNLEGDYECLCISGWTGKNCDENYDECTNNNCYPGSVCIDEVGKYSCKCQPGRIGDHCHLEDKCYPRGRDWRNPCGGNSECQTDRVASSPGH